MRILAFLAALLAVLLAGCGASTERAGEGEAREAAPETAREAPEPTANEQNHPFRQDAEEAYARQVIAAYENGGNATQVECQLAKLQLDVGPEEAQKVVDGFATYEGPTVKELQAQGVPVDEAMDRVIEAQAEGPTLPEYLADKGYAC